MSDLTMPSTMPPTMPLLLDLDVVSLTMSLVNIPSASGAEDALAGAIASALAPLPHLSVARVGTTVVARTPEPDRGADRGADRDVERVLVAGRTSTDGGDPDAFAYVEMGKLHGPGACDAKGALAVALRAAVAVTRPGVTFVLHTGLAALADARPDLLAADVAVVLAPTGGGLADVPAATALGRLAELAEVPGVATTGAGRQEVELLRARGIAAVAFGPGDPAVAQKADEFVPTAELTQAEYVLRTWLQG